MYSNITADPVSYCNGQPILGGDGKIGVNTTFSRTYTNIPPTYKIAWYVINFWIFGPIDSTQGLSINVTGSNVTQSSFKMDYNTAKWTPNACGSGKYGLISAQVYVGTYKVGTTVRLDIKNLKDWGGSIPQFGLRDISVYYSSWPQNLLSYCGPLGNTYSPITPQCTFYLNGSYLLSGQVKTCSTSQCKTCISAAANCYSCQYKQFYSSQYCYNCHTSCDTCNGTASNNCLSCPSGKYLFKNQTCGGTCPSPYQVVTQTEIVYCNFPCPSSSYYYVNGSCLATCTSPFTSQFSGTDAMCNFACSAGNFLYPNNTCKATCDSPFQSVNEGGFLYCRYPCQPTANYKYFNSSCLGSCVSPFIGITDSNSINLCKNPCEGYPSNYVYWNSSCLATCTSPLIQQTRSNGVLLCIYPCAAGQYLYLNGSCIGLCNSPMVIRNNSGSVYCDFPCGASQYVYPNGSCQNSCQAPFFGRNEPNANFCQFPCGTGQYYYQNGSCLSTCNSPRLQRSDYGKLFCDFPCSSSEYFYPNGSCLSTCDPPFIIQNKMDGFYCEAPCSGGLYYYQNGSCISTCNTPRLGRTTAGYNYCDFPCATSQYLFLTNNSCINQCSLPLLTQDELDGTACYYPCQVGAYLYKNGSCLSECSSPLIMRLDASANQHCDFPCSIAGKYYYANGSCLNSCESNFHQRSEPIGKFCDYPCNSSQYLMKNGSCWDSCDSPMKTQTISGNKFCLSPTNGNCLLEEYQLEDGSCSKSCSQPRVSFTKNNSNFCKSPCFNSELFYYPADRACKESCSKPFTANKMDVYKSCELQGVYAVLQTTRSGVVGVASYSLLASNLISIGSSSGITIGILAKMLQYIKYLKIGYSESLTELLLLWKNNYVSLQVLPSFSEGTKESFGLELMPENFAKWDITSSFISNFSGELASFGIVLFALFLVKVFERLNKTKSWLSAEKVRYVKILVHNTLIMVLYNNLGDILFYSLLAYQYAKTDSFVTIVSLVASIIFCIGGLLALTFHLSLLFRYERFRKEGKSLIESEEIGLIKKYGSVAILFKELREEKFSQQAFMFFFVIRDILCSLLLATIFEQTQIQSILILLLNLLMLGYLLISRPYKPKLEFLQEVFSEMILLSVNLSMLVMAILESTHTLTPKTRDDMSAVIILTNYTFNVMILIFVFMKLYVEIKEIIHSRKIARNKKKKVISIHAIGNSSAQQDQQKGILKSKVGSRNPSVVSHSRDNSRGDLMMMTMKGSNLELDSDFEQSKSKLLFHPISPQSDSKPFLEAKNSVENISTDKLTLNSSRSKDFSNQRRNLRASWRQSQINSQL